MKSTQGVILIMMAALVLYIVWSNRFFNQDGTKAKPKIDQNIIPNVPPVGGGLGPTTPTIPRGILPSAYDQCMRDGGEWNFASNTCILVSSIPSMSRG